jgi:hypothetical protein
LAQLDLWAKVQAQGIDIDTVESFGFSEEFLTTKQKFEAQRAYVRNRVTATPWRGTKRFANGHYECVVYNYVRHHDGTKTILSSLLKAV